jgi:hypothetical protein
MRTRVRWIHAAASMRQRGPFAGHTKARPGLSLSRLATCSLPFNSKLKLETSIASPTRTTIRQGLTLRQLPIKPIAS